MTRFSRVVLPVILLAGVCFFSGCDQIQALRDSVFKKKDSTAPATASVAASASATSNELPPNVIAKVGGWTITAEEFEERLNNLKELLPDFDPQDLNARRLILEELVRQQLLVMDAERAGIGQKKEIRDAVEDFRRTLLVQELAVQLTSGIEATESEARQFYEDNKDQFADEEQMRLREIMLNDQGAANEILVQLLQGADFAEIARTSSRAPSAANGGDLGYVNVASSPGLAGTLNSLGAGQTTSVISGPDGNFYIYKVEDKRAGEAPLFVDIKEELIAGLTLQKQQQAVLERLQALSTDVDIQVNEKLLE